MTSTDWFEVVLIILLLFHLHHPPCAARLSASAGTVVRVRYAGNNMIVSRMRACPRLGAAAGGCQFACGS